ncbi:MAG: hypothetical protein MUD01_12740 [Chloroflexaceae bacterium]|nr:hypothetical protein [Chloroflexaceae bacterium]
MKPLRRKPGVAVLLLAGLLALLVGYWLLPIQGQILILTDGQTRPVGAWPQLWLEPPAARPGEPVALYVRDEQPWAHVKLLVNGRETQRDGSFPTGSGPWTWRWTMSLPATPGTEARFYHSCQTGCIERARLALGEPAPAATASARVPTKLGVVFADPNRNWHNRSGWTVELTYADQPDDVDLSIDGLAQRVFAAEKASLRVLVRVDWNRSRSLPPEQDEVALARFRDYAARLARDERLRGVYAYIIGSDLNRQATPEWYARLFNGYGLPAERNDNLVQAMRAANPNLRLLVGTVTPWVTERSGALQAQIDQPWLNYFATLLAHLGQSANGKATANMPFAMADGFALQAPGRPADPTVADAPATEPSRDMQRPEWGGAQAGFRVYRDWLAIINGNQASAGLPVYITSTNTFTANVSTPPAQNYPPGWLSSALAEVNGQRQVQALCWFVDTPLGNRWGEFSLQRPMGRMNEAAAEFDRLLQR